MTGSPSQATASYTLEPLWDEIPRKSSLLFVVVERFLAVYGQHGPSSQKNGAQITLVIFEYDIDACRPDQNTGVVYIHRRGAGAIRIDGIGAGECFLNDCSVETSSLRSGQIPREVQGNKPNGSDGSQCRNSSGS